MASNNFLLYGSKKSVGNITTYKRNGKQVVRAKSTSVANPKTTGQCAQRSIFAPASKFFSPLAIVLRQAWENKNTSNSYSEFLKENIKNGRSNNWLLPKNTGFFPLPYQISRGSLMSIDYTFDAVEECARIDGDYQVLSAPQTVAELSNFLIDVLGYKAGDQVTFICVNSKTDLNSPAKATMENVFAADYYPMTGYIIINPNNLQTLASAMPQIEFDYDNEVCVRGKNGHCVAAGIIISRYENKKWRRSKQFIQVSPYILNAVQEGVDSGYSISTYGDGTDNVPTSDIYLNQSTNIDSRVTLSLAASPSGAGHVTGGGKYQPGTEVTITAVTESEDATFLGWYNGAELVSTDLVYSFNIMASMNLTAKWEMPYMNPQIAITANGQQVTADIQDSNRITVTTPMTQIVIEGEMLDQMGLRTSENEFVLSENNTKATWTGEKTLGGLTVYANDQAILNITVVAAPAHNPATCTITVEGQTSTVDMYNGTTGQDVYGSDLTKVVLTGTDLNTLNLTAGKTAGSMAAMTLSDNNTKATWEGHCVANETLFLKKDGVALYQFNVQENG